MQEKIIEELRQELKAQIEENKEQLDSITWWKNRYEAQVKINEEHKKLNGELRKEIDGLITVIDLAKGYINHAQNYGTMAQVMPHLKPYVNGNDLLEILERVNESEVK